MRRRVIAAAAVLTALVAAAVPAAADLAQNWRVQTNPVDYTPQVLDGEVRAFALVGRTVVVGGDFTTVSDSTGRARIGRGNIFAFDLYTGAISGFAPKVDGPVLTLAAGPNNTVYLGG